MDCRPMEFFSRKETAPGGEAGPWRAILDLGSNTFQLLAGRIHHGRPEMVLREQRFAGLGIGSLSGGEITAAAAARSLAVLEEFALLIRPLGIDPATARVLGTSALRHAGNATGFADRVREKTGFRIRIISGEEEAGLIRAGDRKSVV